MLFRGQTFKYKKRSTGLQNINKEHLEVGSESGKCVQVE
jgi:hypothetical protein